MGRHANPPPPAGVPDMPDYLTPEATRYWPLAVKELSKAGVLSLMDSISLAVYAEAFAAWRHAIVMVKETKGQVIAARTGTLMENPWSIVQRKNQEQLLRVVNAFGLRRATRTGDQIKAARAAVADAPKGLLENPFGAIRRRRQPQRETEA